MFPGFYQAFSTFMDNQGDMAFAGITQQGTAAAVYWVQAGTSSPVKVAKTGDACPAPCPVPGPPVFLGVSGPFAIGESGEVVFSAELQGSQITPTWILYLYSPSTGTYTKIAADGAGGDVTPVGGFFTSQNFFGSMGVVPSTGDVIFSDLVTGGTSTGGIFRFARATGVLSKLVAQGDATPSGTVGTLGIPLGTISGQSLVFYASVSGGSTNQLIGLIPDTTISGPKTTLIAYQGEATGTVAGGTFDTTGDPHLPFAFFGEGLGTPRVRKDGSVIFSSILAGASSSSGAPADQGLFLWNGRAMSKIVVDGDQLSNGKTLQGIVQFAVNNVGDIYYFATSEN